MIILSGGNHAGVELDWNPHGILEDGREYVLVYKQIYAKADDSQAVYYGEQE